MSNWDALLAALIGCPHLPGARCRGRPHLFDDAAADEPVEVVRQRHRQALALCAGCPSLDPCRVWFTALAPDKKPTGVVAGIVHTPKKKQGVKTA